MSARPFGRRGAFLPFLAYLAFVVYGSLVPFDYHDMPMDVASRTFENIPYLQLGLASRADWVANIVLYIPLAFLGCSAVIGLRSLGSLRHGVMLLVFLFCLAVAVGVEFTQIFFAPRTVSLNDLWAETIGTALGIAIFGLGRWRIVLLLDAIAQGGRRSVVAAIAAYVLVYVALSLFPYDFLISSEELASKLESDTLGWLIAGECSFGLRCLARLAGEAVTIAPLGILIAFVSPGLSYRRIFELGAGFGLVIELIQVFLASGVSQGLSVPLRGLGLVAGAAVGRRLLRQGPYPVAHLIRWAMPYALLPYLATLAALGGWLGGHWLSPEEALERLGGVRFLPFYYHYFTTETVAMASVFAQAGMYGPVGLAVWASGARGLPARRGGALRAALWAAGLALPIEFGKLLVEPQHPDPTNVLIVAGSAAFIFSLARWMERVLLGGRPQDQRRREFVAPVVGKRSPSEGLAPAKAAAAEPRARAVEAPSPVRNTGLPKVQTGSGRAPAHGSRPPRNRESLSREGGKKIDPAEGRRIPSAAFPLHPGAALAGSAAACAALAGLWAYPVGTPWLLAGLLAYAALLWYRPRMWAFVVPALLPALDLSAHTGRLLLDEFDLFVLVTLALGYPRAFGMKPLPWPNRWLPWALALLWSSWALSSARGLWPLLGGAGGMAASSHSPLEAWQVGKGLLWALLLVPLMRRLPWQRIEAVRRRMGNGFLTGLGIVVLAVLYERHIFVGVTDFENLFRVTGTFTGMNTGGAYIEGFLAFAFPLLAAAVLRADRWALRAAGVAAAGLVTYAMMVTFSRGGYAGLAAGLVPVALALLRQGGGFAWRRWLALAGLLAASVAAAVPVLSGGFAQSRMAIIGQDLSVREAHWKRALRLMDRGPLAPAIGMGFGRYPTLYLLRGEGERPPGTYGVLNEGGNPYLRLGAGETAFLDQIVDIEPEQGYTLSVRFRQPAGAATLGVALCEKALLYSFECIWPGLPQEKAGSGWHRAVVAVDSGQLGGGGNWPYRPVKLSLHNGGSGGPIDVDEVSLRSRDGRELLANGGFGEGTRRWLFVTDQDLAWHIHQQEVEMYFAQGLLGLAALALLLAGTARALWPAILAGDLRAAGFAGALLAFLTVGLLGSTMDTARLSMLFYLGAFGAGLLTRTAWRAHDCL